MDLNGWFWVKWPVKHDSMGCTQWRPIVDPLPWPAMACQWRHDTEAFVVCRVPCSISITASAKRWEQVASTPWQTAAWLASSERECSSIPVMHMWHVGMSHNLIPWWRKLAGSYRCSSQRLTHPYIPIISNWSKLYESKGFWRFPNLLAVTHFLCRSMLWPRHLCVLLPLVRPGTAFRSSGCRHEPTPEGAAGWHQCGKPNAMNRIV